MNELTIDGLNLKCCHDHAAHPVERYQDYINSGHSFMCQWRHWSQHLYICEKINNHKEVAVYYNADRYTASQITDVWHAGLLSWERDYQKADLKYPDDPRYWFEFLGLLVVRDDVWSIELWRNIATHTATVDSTQMTQAQFEQHMRQKQDTLLREIFG